MAGHLPKTGDKEYDKFLVKTLGKCLPAIIIGVCESKPRDPIEWIAENLYEAVDNRDRHAYMIKYKQYLKMCVDEQKLMDHNRMLQMKSYQQMGAQYEEEYKRNREKEEKINKWLLKDESSLALMSDEERGKVLERIYRARRESLDERKRLLAVKQSWEQSVLNPRRFRTFVERTIQVHKKEALDALKRRVTLSTVRSNIETSLEKKESPKKLTVPSRGSSRSSSRYSGHSSKSSYTESSSSLGSLPSLSDFSAERLDRRELKYEKMQAKRQLAMALKRGDFEETEDGVKVFMPQNWGKMGLKPEIHTDSMAPRCNTGTLLPSTWEEEGYHCKVFYEPELYIRCDRDSSRRSSLSRHKYYSRRGSRKVKLDISGSSDLHVSKSPVLGKSKSSRLNLKSTQKLNSSHQSRDENKAEFVSSINLNDE